MSVTFQDPQLYRSPQRLRYRASIDPGTVIGSVGYLHMNKLPGDLYPGMILDASDGPLLDYFNYLMTTYHPANMAGMLIDIANNASIIVTKSGTAESISNVSWALHTVGPDTALSIKIELNAGSGGVLKYCDVDVFLFVDTSDTYTTKTTDGAALIARQTIGQLAFVPFEFAVGLGGFDELSPQRATFVDPLATSLEHEIYRSPLERFESPTDSTLSLTCRIPPNTLTAPLGELGTFVKLTVVNNNTPLPGRIATLNIGDIFLFTISHFPMRCITPGTTDLHRILVNL